MVQNGLISRDQRLKVYQLNLLVPVVFA
uniref:Uncharacterized protein n=1 Tax=Tetranychus urticae TaxID=32264 RepID=T1JUH5_TETUR